MEKTLEQKRLDFLNDTVSYYSADTSRRCFRVITGNTGYTFNRCMYRYNGKTCAIGRHIADDQYHPTIEGCSVKQQTVFNLLPLNVQELGEHFLIDIQTLHDIDSYWESESGLTEEGAKAVEKIIKKWSIVDTTENNS